MGQVRTADWFVANLEHLLRPVWLRRGIDRNVAGEAFVGIMHAIGLDLAVASEHVQQSSSYCLRPLTSFSITRDKCLYDFGEACRRERIDLAQQTIRGVK